ncbi:MAG: hypothetical protein QG577_1335 [Thermodesulfobacteriota bacterium]|nr:hypothetical protein [Thermodesulfobacteriota bacterium]
MHDLSREELSGLLGILAGNVLVHYGMWFSETVRRVGLDNAVQLEQEAFQKYGPLAMTRLGPTIGAHPSLAFTDQIAQKKQEDLREILDNLAKTWVISDGCWFQAVEAVHGMTVAKEINDQCWFNFAAIEAFKILSFCGLEKGCGLQGLQQSLEFRTYSIINSHSSHIELDGSLLFVMEECRVQSSRRRKNLADYPCKSAGMIEYSQFATCIDPGITTECLYCPPDPMEKDQFCGWLFKID